MSRDREVVALIVLGSVVLVTGAAHAAYTSTAGVDTLHLVIDGIVFVGGGFALLYGAWWYARHDLESTSARRVVGWCTLAAAFAVGFAITSLYVGSESVTPGELAEVAHIASSVGLVAGALLGMLEGVAMEQSSRAARQRARADLLEEERQHLEELNDLMRHYILNGVNIVDGYAERLRATGSPPDRDAIEVIQTQTDTLTVLAEHFRPLSDRRSRGGVAEAVDVDRAIDAIAVDLKREADASVDRSDSIGTREVPTTFPDALELLVRAAVVLADGDPSIEVEGGTHDDGVELEVTVQPINLTEAEAEALFEPIGTAPGLGLYLANEVLAERGRVELRDVMDAQATFVLRAGHGAR
ncbi:MAG: sensor histidine kinase [Halobacteriales archaeon]